jgi:hypothetical protein
VPTVLLDAELLTGTAALLWILHRCLWRVWRWAGLFTYAVPPARGPRAVLEAAQRIPNGETVVDALTAYAGDTELIPDVIGHLMADLAALQSHLLERRHP